MNNKLINQPSDLDSKDDSYQQAAYSPPDYKDLTSASNALDGAIGSFFNAVMEKSDGE